jgi:hypothetical protein
MAPHRPKEISMRRFFGKLLSRVSDLRTTNTARSTRRGPRRASLQVETLEDRLLLSTLSTVKLSGTTLQVDAAPGFAGPSAPGHPNVHLRQITFEVDPRQSTKLEILDNGTPLARYFIASIKEVDVSLAGLDKVIIDDTSGQPFAPKTQVLLTGSNANSVLELTGSQSIIGETYFGGDASQEASVALGSVVGGSGGYSIHFSSAINSVIDSVTTTVSPVVETYGLNVTLSSQVDGTQSLSGLNIGGSGGGTYTFSNKKFIGLDMLNASASLNLNATTAAAGEQELDVALLATGQSVQINGTPGTVTTSVAAFEDGASVSLVANSGSVSLTGNYSTTVVTLGQVGQGLNSLATTAGINANVSVIGVRTLIVADNGNTTTQENVTVTESTISGSGLFGSDAVKLTYSNTVKLILRTGQLVDGYLVAGSKAGARFSSQIEFADFSKVGLNVIVFVDAGSLLNLGLGNLFGSPNTASLYIVAAAGGTFSQFIPNTPNGTEDVTFGGTDTSQIVYDGFGSVTHS